MLVRVQLPAVFHVSFFTLEISYGKDCSVFVRMAGQPAALDSLLFVEHEARVGLGTLKCRQGPTPYFAFAGLLTRVWYPMQRTSRAPFNGGCIKH